MHRTRRPVPHAQPLPEAAPDPATALPAPLPVPAPLAGPAASAPHPAAAPPPGGREREADRLRRLLTGPGRPPLRLLELGGDPGTGKTRLLTEGAALAAAAGVTVLSGRARGTDRDRPLALFLRPLRDALALPGVGPALTPAERDVLNAHLTPADPDHDPDHDGYGDGDIDVPSPGPAGPRRARLHRAVAALLRAAGDRHRTALCLDDLHRADDASLALLDHLLRHPLPGTRLTLVCALRPRQRPAALAASLAEPDEGYRVERLRLGPLPRTAAAALLGPGRTPEQQRRLYDAAEGNPLHLRVLGAGPDTPDPLLPPDGTGPWVLSDESALLAATALAGELGPLDAVERDVLRAAALFGPEVDPAHLAELAGHGPAVTARALDRLIALDLVRAEHAHGRAYRLRHPVLRAVVHRDTPHGWARAAHRRADHVLRRAGADPARRAPHVARYAEPGDTAALRLLADAAEQVRGDSPAAAASWLTTALTLGPDDAGRTALTAALAHALGTLGRLPESRALLTRLPAPAPGDTARVAFHAMIERHLGNYAGAEALLTTRLTAPATGAPSNPASATVTPTTPTPQAPTPTPESAPRTPAIEPPTPHPSLHALRLELSTVTLLRGDFARSTALAREVLEGDGRRDRHLRLAALVRLTHGAAFAGDVPALLGHAREAGALADALSDADLVPHLDTLAQLAWAEALAERHDDALCHTARGIRLARARGQLFVLPYLLLAHAYTSAAVGRLADALRSAEAAEDDARRMDRPDLLGFALALRAFAHAHLDGPDTAAGLAERALQELGSGGRLRAFTAGVLVGVRLDQGRSAGCLDLARSAAAHVRHPGTARPVRPVCYALAARAAAALGDRDQAAGWARRASYDAEALGLPGQRGHAALARAHAASDPVGPLREAVAGFDAGGLVLMEARARLLLARELTARGPHEGADALEQANRAKSLAHTSGARHLHREAVDLQRRLGALRPRPGGVPRPAVPDLPDLSERERDIARMVALGLSNNDIARSLVVSPKTVEAHLTRIYRKAGVRSRTGLAATVAARTEQVA
ncbi:MULTISPECIES: AAA family ATPase [unclassified Streptomyces]|uniref:helix-turn-helix transcriptional regulator n=1 Tax=unclassified Streptomyces TaxID=2593676 RepID=UPI0038016BA8